MESDGRGSEDRRTDIYDAKSRLDLSLRLEQELRHGDLSGVQVYLMVYLLRHHRDGTYLTEICKEVGVSKSTLSALLKKLRKSGYIRFEENPEDIRRKKVLPTRN